MKNRLFFILAIIVLQSIGFAQSITKPKMILVPKGSFIMGDNSIENATPQHKVTLTGDFYISKYEISNKEYADILNYALSKGYLDLKALQEPNKAVAKGANNGYKYQDVSDEHSQIMFKDGKFIPHPGKENYPVLEVTWYGAAFYCNMLSEIEGLTPLYNLDNWSCQVYGKTGYRLPTEAEWEYTAKYNDSRKYPWGNQDWDNSYANFGNKLNDPSLVISTPQGMYSPKGDSKLGISDLAGNASEWCNDWFNDYPTQEQIDPIGPPPSLFVYLPFFKEYQPLRVVRGGCYLYDSEFRKGMPPPFIIDSVIHKEAINNSFRSFDYKKLSRQVTGFRVVKTIATKNTKPAFTPPER
ncbi:MAG: formylglycine-generating enzyme family protein [Candidatus Omnitrophica bacterium]|nr:formylglycine-generating enzyme family protein [Candidatus Omnitrophota bacterium]